MKLLTFLLAFICTRFTLSAQPFFEWGKNLGGADYDIGNSIVADDKGNVYTVGCFSGTSDFDPGPNNYDLTAAGNLDVFISKVDRAGNFVWAFQFAGVDNEMATSVSLDSKGNVYVTGYFAGTTDFNPASGSYYLTSFGNADIFVSKIDAAGNFVWAKQMGGILDDAAFAIKVDARGNILTTGGFMGSADFNPGSGTNSLTSSGNVGTFISKLNASGNFVWAKTFGGSSDNLGNSLTVNSKGDVFTTGYFDGTADFNPGTGTFNVSSYGNTDVFISKLDSFGNFNLARQIGGTSIDKGWGIAVDNNDNIYTAGEYSDVADLDPGNGTYKVTSAGDFDIFVSKLDATGNFVWGRGMGGTIDDVAYSISVDATGVYTTGTFNSKADFDPGVNTFNLTTSGGRDAFVSKLNVSGNFMWVKQIGGTGADNMGNSIVVDNSKNIYTTGYFTDSVDIDPNPPSNLLASAGSTDIFIQKLSQCVKTTSSINRTACNSYKSPSGRYTWTNSGTYTDTIKNTDGCDSIITVQLKINKNSTRTISVTTCKKYKSPSGKYQWTVSNTYKDTIPNKAGCDSIITIQLTIDNKGTSGTLTASACKKYISPSGKYQWTTSNTYKDTILNKAGCDSIITVQLTIGGLSTSGTLTATACNKYRSPSGKYFWTVSNTYKDTILNKAGCDSIITVTLTINTIDVSVTKVGAKLTANATGVNYQWIDCDNGKQPIAGENSQSYTGATGGNYAVIITKGSCTDTSACYKISSSGIRDNTVGNTFTIYPNPTSGLLNIYSGDNLSGAVFTLLDLQGRIIMQTRGLNGNESFIDLSNQAGGIYFIELTMNNQTTRLKLIKY